MSGCKIRIKVVGANQGRPIFGFFGSSAKDRKASGVGSWWSVLLGVEQWEGVGMAEMAVTMAG